MAAIHVNCKQIKKMSFAEKSEKKAMLHFHEYRTSMSVTKNGSAGVGGRGSDLPKYIHNFGHLSSLNVG